MINRPNRKLPEPHVVAELYASGLTSNQIGERYGVTGRTVRTYMLRHDIPRRPQLGPTSPGWKGDDAGYDAIHQWVNTKHPRTGVCERCGHEAGRTGQTGTHYAFLRHPETHTRDRADYIELCPECHHAMDAAIPRSTKS